MSMYRQLWLSVIASMLAALLASQFASLVSARTYLEAQLTMKNRDNATALALALSQSRPDAIQTVTAAKALFDSGYYELVRVADPHGQRLLELLAQPTEHGAPAWFVNLMPIMAAPGQAQIINGWQQVGTITLLSRSSFAYQALWKSALSMAAVMLIAALIGGILGSLVLRRLRKPMQSVVEQAEAIMEHRFVTIPEPSVPELRRLAQAMNDTVGRLRQSFEDDARRYEFMRKLANYEALSGLARRYFFLSNLSDALVGEDAREGVLAVARISNLAAVNQHYGREAADDLVRHIAAAITAVSARHSTALAGRLNGYDFALLLPSESEPGQFLEVLLTELVRVTEPIASKELSIFIGFARFAPGEETGALLARVDEALAAAESQGISVVREARPATNVPTPVTAAQWRMTLQRALDEPGWRRLQTHPVNLPNMPGDYRECFLTIRTEADSEWQPAGRFIPEAERLGLATKLDLATIDLALEALRQSPDLAGMWLHLSGHSLGDDEFRSALIGRLRASESLPAKLWIQIPEAAAMRRLVALRSLVTDLKPLGCHLGISHCGHRFDRVGLLYELGLDFLKVDASFVHGISASTGNRAFLSGMCDITHRIGLMVVAEGVSSEAEVQTLAELGFDGMTGPGVQVGKPIDHSA